MKKCHHMHITMNTSSILVAGYLLLDQTAPTIISMTQETGIAQIQVQFLCHHLLHRSQSHKISRQLLLYLHHHLLLQLPQLPLPLQLLLLHLLFLEVEVVDHQHRQHHQHLLHLLLQVAEGGLWLIRLLQLNLKKPPRLTMKLQELKGQIQQVEEEKVLEEEEEWV